MAIELLKRAIKHNGSCVKALEYLGFIMEKEASYQDASVYYEDAYQRLKVSKGGQGGQRSSRQQLGYKLAFNYLKAKKYAEAVAVCRELVGSDESPSDDLRDALSQDILSKAKAALRCP